MPQSFFIMPYVRRSRKSRRTYSIVKPVRYSAENYGSILALETTAPNGHAYFNIDLIPVVVNNLGTRKVKNFTLRLWTSDTLDQTPIPDTDPQEWDTVGHLTPCLYWFLVYVPEGTTPYTPQVGIGETALSLYEPNQNVIMSGIIDDSQVYTFKSRLGRNLQSGDTIALVVFDSRTNVSGHRLITDCRFSVSYAISF